MPRNVTLSLLLPSSVGRLFNIFKIEPQIVWPSVSFHNNNIHFFESVHASIREIQWNGLKIDLKINTVKVDCARGVVAAVEDYDAGRRRCSTAARTATSSRVHGKPITDALPVYYNPLL